MHIALKRLLLIIVLPLIIVIGSTSLCYANSPPPPTVSIIVSTPPKDLELSIGSVQGKRTAKIFESYYTFYLKLDDTNPSALMISTSEGTFEIALPQLQRYNNVFRLDIDSRTLTSGASSFRAYQFALITIILTLLIEGALFFLFGYRKRSSWIVFLIVNIITQGLLYVWLNITFYPLVNSYFGSILFSLIRGEFLVFIFEIIAFLIFIRERPRLQTFLYVVAANMASLIAGGYILNALL